jgi:hypothetical protein
MAASRTGAQAASSPRDWRISRIASQRNHSKIHRIAACSKALQLRWAQLVYGREESLMRGFLGQSAHESLQPIGVRWADQSDQAGTPVTQAHGFWQGGGGGIRLSLMDGHDRSVSQTVRLTAPSAREHGAQPIAQALQSHSRPPALRRYALPHSDWRSRPALA